MRKSLVIAGCTALALGLSACGSQEDEARIAELEGQLTSSRTEAEGLRRQFEEARARTVELEEAAAGQDGGVEPEALRQPIATALGALKETDDRLVGLEQELGGQALEKVPLADLRANVAEVSRSIGEVARIVGIDAETLTSR